MGLTWSSHGVREEEVVVEKSGKDHRPKKKKEKFGNCSVCDI